MKTLPQLRKDMDKQLEHLVAKEIVQFRSIRNAWDLFFNNHREYKELRPELMQYLENKYDEMSLNEHFLESVRYGAAEWYQEEQR